MQRWFRDERGATSIEYALIAVIVSISIVGGATMIARNIGTVFAQVGSGLTR